jgi:hypothetical protein
MKPLHKEKLLACACLCLTYMFLFAVAAQDAQQTILVLISALILNGYVLAGEQRKAKW